MVSDAAFAPKTLCVIDTVGRGGGAEQLVADLLPEMRRQGHDIAALALYDWDDDLGVDLERQGVTVHRLHIGRQRSQLSGLLHARKLAKQHGYSQFWGHLFAGNMFARLLQMGRNDASCAITLHSEGYAELESVPLRTKIEIAMHRYMLGGADAKVAVSSAVRDDYAKTFGWRDMPIVHNGIDVGKLRSLAQAQTRTAARASHGYADDDFLIITPARYVSKKGQRFLLEALAQLRDQYGFQAKLFLCGTGPQRQELADLARDLGLGSHVRVEGVIPHAQLLPLIKAADLFVLPSLREPFGIAAAEAMAVGAPAILTKVDGFVELVDDSGGARFVSVADSSALVEAIKELADDQGARHAMGEKAAAHIAASFDIDACAGRWIDLLNRVHKAKAKG